MEVLEGRTSEAAVFVDALNASRQAEHTGPLTLLLLKKRLYALRFELADLRAENAVLRSELEAARDRVAFLDNHIEIVYSSRGWRLVARLRGLRDFLRRLTAPFRPASHRSARP
jgi:hypothetical protein